MNEKFPILKPSELADALCQYPIYDNRKKRYVHHPYRTDNEPMVTNPNFRFSVYGAILDIIGEENKSLTYLSKDIAEKLGLKGDWYNAYFEMPVYDWSSCATGRIYVERYSENGSTIMHSDSLLPLVAFWYTSELLYSLKVFEDYE